MMFLAFLLLIALVMLLWAVEYNLPAGSKLGKNAGARVSGPLFSMSASGSVGKAITYGIWKGRPWCRVHFIPENPRTASQTNVRLAMALLVTSWQNQHVDVQALYDTYADQFNMSGFNQFIKRGMLEYIVQITSAVTPVSVAVDAVAPPGEAWTWT